MDSYRGYLITRPVIAIASQNDSLERVIDTTPDNRLIPEIIEQAWLTYLLYPKNSRDVNVVIVPIESLLYWFRCGKITGDLKEKLNLNAVRLGVKALEQQCSDLGVEICLSSYNGEVQYQADYVDREMSYRFSASRSLWIATQTRVVRVITRNYMVKNYPNALMEVAVHRGGEIQEYAILRIDVLERFLNSGGSQKVMVSESLDLENYTYLISPSSRKGWYVLYNNGQREHKAEVTLQELQAIHSLCAAIREN